MKRKRVLIIWNIASGVGEARQKLPDMIAELSLAGCEVLSCPIVPAKGLDSKDILQHYTKDTLDILVVSGGDGTMNHVVNAMRELGLDLPVVYFSTGSTNDFARSLGITNRVKDLCQAALHGQEFLYDLGLFNEQYYNYVAAFGAFTSISYKTNQDIKNVLGYAAYVLNGVLSAPESLSSRQHLRILHDGTSEEGDYIYGSVSNALSVGGMKPWMLSGTRMDDGFFEVMLIKAPDNINDVAAIVQTLALEQNDSAIRSSQYIHLFRTKEIQFISGAGIDWTIDGEYGGRQKDVRIRVVKKGMRLLVKK